jgi:hypothetical protein
MPDHQKRITLSIQMPSIALLRFIEKVLQDDKFFESAIENPLATMKESGVRLNISKLAPRDLATFFGALAGVKDLIKKKQIKDITFANIFGQSAEIRGTTIMAETQKGMWSSFNRSALTEKQMYAAAETNFETLQLGYGDTEAKAVFTRVSNIRFSGVETTLALQKEYPDTKTSRETDRGSTFHFNADRGVGSQRDSVSDTYTTKNFGGVSVFEPHIIEQILNGPLIDPGDLAAISAQINTYLQVSEQME